MRTRVHFVQHVRIPQNELHGKIIGKMHISCLCVQCPRNCEFFLISRENNEFLFEIIKSPPTGNHFPPNTFPLSPSNLSLILVAASGFSSFSPTLQSQPKLCHLRRVSVWPHVAVSRQKLLAARENSASARQRASCTRPLAGKGSIDACPINVSDAYSGPHSGSMANGICSLIQCTFYRKWRRSSSIFLV